VFPPQTLTPTLNTSSSASALLAESNEGLPTRHTVNSSQVNSSPGRLVTKRRSTRHKQTSKPYCQQCIGPPQLLGRSFQKAKKNSQQVVTRMQDFTSEFSKIFRGWYHRRPGPSQREGLTTPSHTQHIAQTLVTLN